MVVALYPIHKKYRIKRIVVSTYQAVSGTGKKAIDELFDQTRAMINFIDYRQVVYPHRIAFNCLPHIDVFEENGYTKEEMKMLNETRKIFDDDHNRRDGDNRPGSGFFQSFRIDHIETESPVDAAAVKALLADAPGVKVVDDPAHNAYPLATDAAGQDLTLVGRIRTTSRSKTASTCGWCRQYPQRGGYQCGSDRSNSGAHISLGSRRQCPAGPFLKKKSTQSTLDGRYA